MFGGNLISQPAYEKSNFKVHNKLDNAEHILKNFILDRCLSWFKHQLSYVTKNLMSFYQIIKQKSLFF